MMSQVVHFSKSLGYVISSIRVTFLFHIFVVLHFTPITLHRPLQGPSMRTTLMTQRTGRTNPLILTSCAANNPLIGTVVNAGGAAVFSVSCGVVSPTTPNSFTSARLPSCRLYVPSYIMNPTYDSQLIRIRPKREVFYKYIYNFNITNVGAGGTFNNILTNGIVNPKYLVMMPYFTETAANTGLSIAANTYQSVFDTAPGTTATLSGITKFQVQVGGQNMFQQNFQYDLGGPGWLSGSTLLSHKFKSAGLNPRKVNVFHPGLPTSRRIRIMEVTTKRNDGSG